MFLNRQSRTVRLVTTLIVAAWLTVCGQSCAEADMGTAGVHSLAGTADTGGRNTAHTVGGIVVHGARSHTPRHGVNDPGCDASACCAKIVTSDQGKQAIPGTLIPKLAAATVLYTLTVAGPSRMAASIPRRQLIPDLSPLQITGILRI